MNFHAVYRVSFYLMLFFATLVFSIDATDQNRIAMLYPVAVALVGALAFFTVDRNPDLGLSVSAANILSLGSIVLTYAEYRYDPNLMLLALAHWLVYLQIVKMLCPKRSKDDWFLLLIALVQVLVGGVMSQSDAVGMALFGWGLCSLWVLALFTLLREAFRGRPSPGTTVVPMSDPSAPYPGLFDFALVMASVRVAAMTVALGGVIFLVMPRSAAMTSSIKGDPLAKHITGFDDEVQLGQLGEILENDSIVMTVELFDQDNKKIVPEAELLWRGVGMARYERARWRKQRIVRGPFVLDLPSRPREPKLIRQQIRLEPTDNPVLFSLRPVLWAETPLRNFVTEFNQVDGALYRNDSRPISFDYVVISSADLAQDQPKEQFPTDPTMDDLLSMSPSLRAQLRPIALKVVEGIDPGDRLAIGRRLESYLRDSGQFTYTLHMDQIDRDIDPVADFLINRKEGHCEYFGSALTLLLRSLDIPARMVNGFKGGDWNDLAGVLNIRQRHAHSWTEVLISKSPQRDAPPHWVTLDPTPARERDEVVASISGLALVRQVTDFIRYVWVFYVVGFNFERQQKFLYEPIRRLIVEARRGFGMIGQALKQATDWLFHFPSLGSFISPRGFFVTFGSLLLMVAVVRLGIAVARWVRCRWGDHADDAAGVPIGVRIYRRLVSLLEELGQRREPAETPREFARRAASFLAGSGLGTEELADVPPVVVEVYYRIRFGHGEMDDQTLARLEGRLDALEARLKAATA